MDIIIKKEFSEDYTTREAGERLRHKILAAASKTITIDFIDLKIASILFFDEAFAKLFSEGWTQELFDKKIILKNILSMDAKLIKKVCDNRK